MDRVKLEIEPAVTTSPYVDRKHPTLVMVSLDGGAGGIRIAPT